MYDRIKALETGLFSIRLVQVDSGIRSIYFVGDLHSSRAIKGNGSASKNTIRRMSADRHKFLRIWGRSCVFIIVSSHPGQLSEHQGSEGRRLLADPGEPAREGLREAAVGFGEADVNEKRRVFESLFLFESPP